MAQKEEAWVRYCRQKNIPVKQYPTCFQARKRKTRTKFTKPYDDHDTSTLCSEDGLSGCEDLFRLNTTANSNDDKSFCCLLRDKLNISQENDATTTTTTTITTTTTTATITTATITITAVDCKNNTFKSSKSPLASASIKARHRKTNKKLCTRTYPSKSSARKLKPKTKNSNTSDNITNNELDVPSTSSTESGLACFDGSDSMKCEDGRDTSVPTVVLEVERREESFYSDSVEDSPDTTKQNPFLKFEASPKNTDLTPECDCHETRCFFREISNKPNNSTGAITNKAKDDSDSELSDCIRIKPCSPVPSSRSNGVACECGIRFRSCTTMRIHKARGCFKVQINGSAILQEDNQTVYDPDS